MSDSPSNTVSTPTPAKSEGSRRSYRSSDLTRRAILEAASEAFATRGFQGATLRGIAKAAGVDHSTLIHHFSNKESLLQAVLRWKDDRGRPAPPSDPPMLSVAQLISYLTDTARQNQESPQLVQVFSTMSAEAGSLDHPARPYLQQRHQAHLDLLGQAIAKGRQRGLVAKNGLSPREGAVRLVALWEGLEVFDRLHPGMIDLPHILEVSLQEALGFDRDNPEALREVMLDLPPNPLEYWLG